MTQEMNFPALALQTLREPNEAAAIVLDWNLPKEALWTAIALVSVVVTLLSALSNIVLPVPEPLNVLVANPFIYFVIAAGGFVATVYAVYWTGRLMGGQGRIEDLMVLLLWLQALRAAGQALVLVCLLVAPFLASFLVLFIAIATFWIFLNFVSIGLQFNSLLRAFVATLIGAVALVVGLSLLLSLLGISAVGVPLNV